jgi:hypothetical protein
MSFLTGWGVVVIVDFPLTCGVEDDDDEKTAEAIALRGD